jgi:pSer/pThr/pTyr-binding forkhead associated (FHA) protein
MTGRSDWWLHYQAGRGPTRSVQLRPATPLTIGRSSESDITLSDPQISRLHAKLELRDDGVWVMDLDSGNGTYIDRQRVTSRLWEPGKVLRLGGVDFELRRDDNPTTAVVQRRAEVKEETSKQERGERAKKEASKGSVRIAWRSKTPQKSPGEQAITVPIGKALTIGRGPAADIVLEDASVSAKHASITITGHDGARVQDLNSENGTSIDGRRISDQRWTTGQTLEIGSFVLSLGNGSEDSAYERALSARNLRKRNRPKIGTTLVEKLRIFISYSRRDMDAADKLVSALEKSGFEVIVDRRHLPYGEEWQRELADFVRSSDTVLFLISSDSVTSQWCKWELGQVTEHRKRLFPLAIGPVAVEDLPEEISKIHILPPVGLFDLNTHLPELVQALNTDRAWVKEHARLADWAREWRTRGKPRAMLLRGAALEAAEIWQYQRPKSEKAAAAVLELIKASQRGRLGRRASWTAGAAAVLTGIGLVAAAYMDLGPRGAIRALAGKVGVESPKLLAFQNREAAETERRQALEQERRARELRDAAEREQREAAERQRQEALEQERRAREEREAAEREQRAAAERERQQALEREHQLAEERRRIATLERWQGSPNRALRWWIRNGTSRKLRVHFSSQDRENTYWPGGEKFWTLLPGQRIPYDLACKLGESICFGAFVEDGSTHWGVGRSGKEGCEKCCGACGAGDLSNNLVE